MQQYLVFITPGILNAMLLIGSKTHCPTSQEIEPMLLDLNTKELTVYAQSKSCFPIRRAPFVKIC